MNSHSHTFSNFTQQLKCMSLILDSAVVLLLCSGDLWDTRIVYLTFQGLIMIPTLILFVLTCVDAIRDSRTLLKFEYMVFLFGGFLLMASSIATIIGFGRYRSMALTLSAGVIGLLLNGPLHLFLAWQLNGAAERDPEKMRPFYFALGVGQNPLRLVVDTEPHKYTGGM